MKQRGRHRRRKRGQALRAFLAGTALALTAAATMISASQATVAANPGTLKPLTSAAETDPLRLKESRVPQSDLDRLSSAMGRPAGVSAVLAQLTERVDLLQMAIRAGAADALPPGLVPGEQLLIVHDFPHGFDDRAVTQLRYLADEGPSVGVHLMMVADRDEASGYGPVLDPLWRKLLRITPVADDHLADPWVGHAWSYEPPLVPQGSRILWQVLTQVADARRQWGR